MPDDSFLVTVGEVDCSILIWAYKANLIHGDDSLSGRGSPLNLQLGNIRRDADINESLEKIGGKSPGADENLLDA